MTGAVMVQPYATSAQIPARKGFSAVKFKLRGINPGAKEKVSNASHVSFGNMRGATVYPLRPPQGCELLFSLMNHSES